MIEYWYHLKHKVIPSWGAMIAKRLLSLIYKTCAIEVAGIDKFKEVAGKSPCILILWHNRLALAPQILSTLAGEYTYAALVSQSRDGEIIASVVESYPIGRTIRVPHNDRLKALNMVITKLQTENDIVVITPDGPRGPRYKVKGGTLHAAKATGAYLVPFSWSGDKLWTLNSWDKMQFPKPFSSIKVTFGAPYQLSSEEGSPTDEELRMVEASLS
jgi:lysophospholipid acyltransferase (LPLAT)-like uncharacterized protein